MTVFQGHRRTDAVLGAEKAGEEAYVYTVTSTQRLCNDEMRWARMSDYGRK